MASENCPDTLVGNQYNNHPGLPLYDQLLFKDHMRSRVDK